MVQKCVSSRGEAVCQRQRAELLGRLLSKPVGRGEDGKGRRGGAEQGAAGRDVPGKGGALSQGWDLEAVLARRQREFNRAFLRVRNQKDRLVRLALLV